MAERDRARAPDSRPILYQIVRPTTAMDSERQLTHLYTEFNRIIAILSNEVNSLRARLDALEKE